MHTPRKKKGLHSNIGVHLGENTQDAKYCHKSCPRLPLYQKSWKKKCSNSLNGYGSDVCFQAGGWWFNSPTFIFPFSTLLLFFPFPLCFLYPLPLSFFSYFYFFLIFYAFYNFLQLFFFYFFSFHIYSLYLFFH